MPAEFDNAGVPVDSPFCGADAVCTLTDMNVAWAYVTVFVVVLASYPLMALVIEGRVLPRLRGVS